LKLVGQVNYVRAGPEAAPCFMALYPSGLPRQAGSRKDIQHTMRSAPEAALQSSPPTDTVSSRHAVSAIVDQILVWLDDAKAENIVTIDIKGKTSIGDTMIVASGRSDRHVGAVADQLQIKLKEAGVSRVRVEGKPQCDWVLIDAGDIIVHLFRPEVREFYNLEKMWSADRPAEPTAH
jgi:ribosome-associated protein